jgi:hypothetical protein
MPRSNQTVGMRASNRTSSHDTEIAALQTELVELRIDLPGYERDWFRNSDCQEFFIGPDEIRAEIKQLET